MKQDRGFTLIELIIFIVIAGIIASMLFTSYLTILRRSPVINQQIDATQIATRCMEWYLGQRFINGFSSLTCPSTSTPTFCSANLPTGYTINANVSCATLYSDSTNYKTITVNVSGAGSSTLSTIITNY